MCTKKSLRKELLSKRSGLSQEERTAASLQVQNQLMKLPVWQTAKQVLVYWPLGAELDIRPLVMDLWDRNVEVLLPRCLEEKEGAMELVCVTCVSELTQGSYNIMEPAQACRIPQTIELAPDLALIPGIGFDKRGYRLGFGGGYYDRVLGTSLFKDTITVGMAYDFQLLEALPVEKWDQPVTYICTESQLWRP